MRKKVWTVMPVFLILVALMALMAVVTYHYNRILSLVEIGVTIAALSAILVMTLNFRKYVRRITKDAVESTGMPDANVIEHIKTPAAVCGHRGEILFYNERFQKEFFDNTDPENDSIESLLGGFSLSRALSEDSVDVDFGEKRYTVYARPLAGGGAIVEFIDNTFFKNTVDEFRETRKSVAIIVFDNIDDFSSDSEQEAMTAFVTVENLLYRWATKHNSLLRKLSDRRYIAVFDERVLRVQIDKKFKILDKIRSVTYNGRAATVSIGIGRGFDTITESAVGAKRALDMALGRGGDQVAILKDGEYQFFGGVERGVEKTSKVRARLFSDSIKSAIADADRVLIMGHKYSDLDCIGSAAGMYALVKKKFRKPCQIVVDAERSMARQMIERLKRDDGERFISPEHALLVTGPKTMLIIVDTHSPDFIESEKVLKAAGIVVIIDHHRKMVNFIDKANVFFHEPSASSSSELVSEIVEYLGDEVLGHIEAEALLAGIMLDTKNFVINTGVRTFEAAAYLRRKGADTVAVRDVFANSIENYRDKAQLVSSAQLVNHCAITVSEKPIRNSRIVCAQAADDLLAIEDTYASFVISAIDRSTVNISARSFGKVNVQLIMETLGGGGHQTMAAAQLHGVSLEEAKTKLVEVLKKQEIIT